jgi:tRNA modification GTPase
MYQLEDTICAIATPAGVGGIGIVRVSGPRAFEISSRLFPFPQPLEKKRHLLLGKFTDPRDGEFLDEGLLLVMPGPHSYTAEDVVEFHAHGSPALLSKLLEILTFLGARLAEPGEFTYRAFVHGRLELTQAEAVEDLVSAQGDADRRQALKQLTGGLASHLEPLEESLKSLYLKIEARLEFSDDGIPPLDEAKFKEELSAVRKQLLKLLQSYSQGKVIKDGLCVAIVGPPNVGKSSLLNSLLGTGRAIVTPVAGTTRDVVEGDIQLKGVKIRLFDTAGIRPTQNEVEEEGVRRSLKVIEEADMILWMADASAPQESLKQAKQTGLSSENTWYLFNKTDLAKDQKPWANTGLPEKSCFGLSCKTQEGLDELLEKLENLVQTNITDGDVILTSQRHQKEVQTAYEALGKLEALMKEKRPYELWAEELKEAALAIGRIRGRNLPAAAFEEIFSRFCVGK